MHERGPHLKPLINAINLSVIEHALKPHYKKWEEGDHQPGRTPCNPVGMVLALIIMLVKGWFRPDLTDFLAKHPEWLHFLHFEHVPDESTWSKLLNRVPLATLETILSGIVRDLTRKGFLRFSVAGADSTFVAACHWDADARWGYVRPEEHRSLPQGRFVEKDGKTLGFGYRVHVVADADAGLAVSVLVTPANVNDSVAWPALFRESRAATPWERVGHFVADKGFDAVSVRASMRVFPVRVLIPPQRLSGRVAWGGF
ncbi:MAG: transposase, partial [bacterium]